MYNLIENVTTEHLCVKHTLKENGMEFTLFNFINTFVQVFIFIYKIVYPKVHNLLFVKSRITINICSMTDQQ